MMKKLKKIKIIFVLVSVLFYAVPVYAADDPLTAINNLSNLIFSAVRLIGVVMAVLGVAQFGMSFRSHDTSQRTTGFLSAVGGIIVIFSKEIINFIAG